MVQDAAGRGLDGTWRAVPALTTIDAAGVRWNGSAYWTYGATSTAAPSVATFDETGALVEEHVAAPSSPPLLGPQLLGDLVVDGTYDRQAGGCDTLAANAWPRALDAAPVRTNLLPADFQPESRNLWPGYVLATSPTRALFIYSGRCWDWVRGLPYCADWLHAAPQPTLATVLGSEGAPVAVGVRLPDIEPIALHWDGNRFVALLYVVPTYSCDCCDCFCDPPPPGAALWLAAVPQQREHVPEAAPDADDVVGPDDPGRDRRLAWADLFRRVFAQDVLVCSRCGGTMRLIAVVTDATVVERILRHLRLWERGPPRGRHVMVESRDHESRDVNLRHPLHHRLPQPRPSPVPHPPHRRWRGLELRARLHIPPYRTYTFFHNS